MGTRSHRSRRLLVLTALAVATLPVTAAQGEPTAPPTGTLEVAVSVRPAEDPGRFDLSVDGGQFEDRDVTDGKSTGERTVLAGSHTVVQAAGTDTDLADYEVSLSCVDQADNDASVDSSAGEVLVGSGADVLCTFTNTRQNRPPDTPTVTASETFGPAPLAVTASVPKASDPDGEIASYRFDWGDGTTSDTQESSAAHTYADAGEFMLRVTVIDEQGAEASSSALEIATVQSELLSAPASDAPALPDTLFAAPRSGNGLPTRNYLAVLGDSYSSGEGAGYDTDIGYENGDCHFHRRGYAARVGWGYTSKACSGALTRHVVDTRFQAGNRNEAPQVQQLADHIAAVDAFPRVVVFSAGGNDLGFAETVRTCVYDNAQPGPDRDCNRALDAIRTQLNANVHYQRVSRVISAIKAKTSASTTVIVMGYPALFAKRPQGRSCAVNGAEARRTRRLTRATNAQADKAAKDAGAVYISTTPAFADHHLCDGNNNNDWFVPILRGPPQAAHPTAAGYRAEGELLRDCIANLAACKQRYQQRTATVFDRLRVGQGGWTVALEEDSEAEAPAPGVPAAPRVTLVGNRYRFSWPAVPNAMWYALEAVEPTGVFGFAQTDATTIEVPVSEAGPAGTCVHLTAFSDDEGEVTGPCARLPAPPPPPPVNQRPIANDQRITVYRNQWANGTRLDARDPELAGLTYRLISQSFAQANFPTFVFGQPFAIKIPATATVGGVLHFTYEVRDPGGLTDTAQVTMDIR
jgi:PKD repeat protein